MNHQVFKWTKIKKKDLSTLPDVFDTKKEDWTKPDTCIFEMGSEVLVTDKRGAVFAAYPTIDIQEGVLQEFRWSHGIVSLIDGDVIAWAHFPEPYHNAEAK